MPPPRTASIDPVLLVAAGGSDFSVYNLNRQNTWSTRKALANARLGLGVRPIFCYAADSTTRGGLLTTYTQAWPLRMSAMLTSLGVPVQDDAEFGYIANKSTAQMTAYDPRITFGAGWDSLNSIYTGGYFYRNTTTTNALTFAPVGQFDTVDIWSKTNSGFGTVTADIDGAVSGGGFATINLNVASSFIKTTLTATLGTHAVNIKRVSGNCYHVGFAAYNSAASVIRNMNTATGSSATTNWLASDFGGNLNTIGANVVFISLGINEWEAASSLAIYTANLQVIISQYKTANCDVWLVDENETGGTATPAIQQTFRDAMKALAASNNVPFVSQRERLGSYTLLNSLGFMVDTVHPGPVPNDDLGRFMAQLLVSL